MADETLKTVLPPIKVTDNGDGTWSISIEDVNSDAILAALIAGNVDLAALEVINTAIQAATEASAVDLAAIEIINTAIQVATEATQTAGAVTMAHTPPVIGAGTTLALAANANREYAMFINDSDEVIYIELGDDAVMNEGIRLNADGGSFEMSRKIGNLDTRVVNGICASGSKVLLVTEGV